MESGKRRMSPFPTTQWSLIVRAASDDQSERDTALAEICTLYWPPVYAFIRSRGHSPHDAEDLTQGLFAELIERQDFARADSKHGKLRSYLLTSATNHLASERRKQRRIKRGGTDALLSIDARTAEMRCLIPEPVDELSPDRVFERQWAITVMERVVCSLEERYVQKGQGEIFNALKPFINLTEIPAPQGDVAEQLGMTGQALRVALYRLRQRYAGLLRETVSETLGADENVDAEIAHLISTFG
jgi:RNA polymerase sigma factor (sigma-70 family)